MGNIRLVFDISCSNIMLWFSILHPKGTEMQDVTVSVNKLISPGENPSFMCPLFSGNSGIFSSGFFSGNCDKGWSIHFFLK